MNPQIKRKNGKVVSRGIEWCTHTNNALRGCLHGCRWNIGGEVARCYAEVQAEGPYLTHVYNKGFAHAYAIDSNALYAPEKVKRPARIFVDSMGDIFGRWVNDVDLGILFNAYHRSNQHTFLSLTKNPVRLVRLANLPRNLHVGFSSPADYMFGRELTEVQKIAWLDRALTVWDTLNASVRWMSIEPLTMQSLPHILMDHKPLDWAVIGAASVGNRKIQPDMELLDKAIGALDAMGVPVFFKGNLKGNPLCKEWREFLPGFERMCQDCGMGETQCQCKREKSQELI